MKVTTTIMGVDVSIHVSSDNDRRGRRLGSIPLIDDKGRKHLVRVYGTIDRVFSTQERMAFEKTIRAFCARPDVVEALLGESSPVIPVRFNPSELLLQSGWKNRGSVSVAAY